MLLERSGFSAVLRLGLLYDFHVVYYICLCGVFGIVAVWGSLVLSAGVASCNAVAGVAANAVAMLRLRLSEAVAVAGAAAAAYACFGRIRQGCSRLFCQRCQWCGFS